MSGPTPVIGWSLTISIPERSIASRSWFERTLASVVAECCPASSDLENRVETVGELGRRERDEDAGDDRQQAEQPKSRMSSRMAMPVQAPTPRYGSRWSPARRSVPAARASATSAPGGRTTPARRPGRQSASADPSRSCTCRAHPAAAVPPDIVPFRIPNWTMPMAALSAATLMMTSTAVRLRGPRSRR